MDEILRKSITEQGETVRQLKESGAAKEQVDEAVDKLVKLKAQLDELVAAAEAKRKEGKALRSLIEDTLIRKFFIVPSFEIYGGVAGLYDFGPPGCALMQNVLNYWRQHFVLTENMLEVHCTNMTPEVVLKTSGHVDRFTDFMVKDVKTGDCYRADKILEDFIDNMIDDPKNAFTKEQREELLAIRTQAGAYDQKSLDEQLKKLKVKAPDSGNDLTDPFPFNLMFVTQIGPTGKLTGYLRPETAQGIFVNFKRLLEYNNGRMPFAAAQIGTAFRNEIAPRAGLLRVREFPLAEIEHFVNPTDKKHPKFHEVADMKLSLLAREDQTGEDIPRTMTVKQAVDQGTINNETLAYFLARTNLFLTSIGIKPERLRFRQHKSTEMAHYAQDCWDAEILTTYGWIECVGHADRAAYDLQVHSKKSGKDLVATEVFSEPRIVKVPRIMQNKGLIGRHFKKEASKVGDYLTELKLEQAIELKESLAKGPVTFTVCTGESFTITSEMVSVNIEEQKISVQKYIPNVIEPSFGVGRILYSLLEHSFTQREAKEEKRVILSLPPLVAPIKCFVLPLSSNDTLDPIVNKLLANIIGMSLAAKTDSSGASIGRRYARADEVGTPFCVTIDFDTPKDNTVTIRDRDTTQQIRVNLDEVPILLARLCSAQYKWAQAYEAYPKVIREETD